MIGPRLRPTPRDVIDIEEARERPILFSAPMVRAILDGRKTMTRRLFKVPPGVDPQHFDFTSWGKLVHWPGDEGVTMDVTCPYGAPGDRLWVRETWAVPGTVARSDDPIGLPGQRVVYRADAGQDDYHSWRPSIFMPRWASRITLEVTGVRVERLQEITDSEAYAEGIRMPGKGETVYAGSARAHFHELWDSINAKRANWASNPWVWVVEFRRLP